MFDDETALIPSLRGGEAADIVSKVGEGEEAAIEEALAVLEAGTPEDEKDRVSKVTANLSCSICKATKGLLFWAQDLFLFALVVRP